MKKILHQPTEIIFYTAYPSKNILHERYLVALSDCYEEIEANPMNWIKITGDLSTLALDTKVTSELQTKFSISSDILSSLHIKKQSKVYFNDAYILLKFNNIYYDKAKKIFKTEPIVLILGDNYIISLSNNNIPIFDSVIKKINLSNKEHKSDYIFYSLLNLFIDNYYIVLDDLSNEIESAEKLILEKQKASINMVHKLKDDIILFRKCIWPFREIMYNIRDSQDILISDEIKDKMRYIYNDILYIIENIDILKDSVNNMFEIYLSVVNNRMSEIMKVLTVISTIFIPLNFLVGMYGMNFETIPTSKNPMGFYYNVGGMICLALTMAIVFKIKKWY